MVRHKKELKWYCIFCGEEFESFFYHKIHHCNEIEENHDITSR